MGISLPYLAAAWACGRALSRGLAGTARIDWFEAISRTSVRGGRPLRVLERARALAPVALHGVSLSLGSVDALRPDYLDDLAALAERVEPAWISDHLCWGSVGGHYAHDLLPLPYTDEALAHVVDRVRQVQDALGRRILLENVSSYVAFAHSTMTEWTFLGAIAAGADCGILLDVNNVFVSAANHGFQAGDYLAGLPAERIERIISQGTAITAPPARYARRSRPRGRLEPLPEAVHRFRPSRPWSSGTITYRHRGRARRGRACPHRRGGTLSRHVERSPALHELRALFWRALNGSVDPPSRRRSSTRRYRADRIGIYRGCTSIASRRAGRGLQRGRCSARALRETVRAYLAALRRAPLGRHLGSLCRLHRPTPGGGTAHGWQTRPPGMGAREAFDADATPITVHAWQPCPLRAVRPPLVPVGDGRPGERPAVLLATRHGRDRAARLATGRRGVPRAHGCLGA